jgi:DEAD/DEAH box helicase domain-containing protein
VSSFTQVQPKRRLRASQRAGGPAAREGAPPPRSGQPASAGADSPGAGSPGAGDAAKAARTLEDRARRGRLTHVEHIPARPGRSAAWPPWVPGVITQRLRAAGVTQPWEHQVAVAELARGGRNVIVSTGTASGKSLGYLLPALTAVLEGGAVLYIAPSKALAADQLRVLGDIAPGQVCAAAVDGDTTRSERDWARSHANYVLTNPDMLHHNLLPQHNRWAAFFRRVQFVVIDECHQYRGVFGSHMAQIIRRLRRITSLHGRPPGGKPVFILSSATVSEPGRHARMLTGLDAEEVTQDGSPHGPVTFGFCEPPLTGLRGEAGAPLRRTAAAETADLLADLVADGVRTLAFVRSRRSAETIALAAKRALAEAGGGELAAQVASYRAGYLPEDRRAVEQALRSGALNGLATTNALELGVDICGLDAVILAGWPGTRASLWQQAGRAGRGGGGAVAVLVARDDPLDTYVVHNPKAVFGAPVEAAVLDPDNPYVLAPHLCAAARELPLTTGDFALFGPAAPGVVDRLTERKLLRRRDAGWFWARRERVPDSTANIRGAGGSCVQIVEETTGRLLGTLDEPSAHTMAHTGAVYLHQGETYLVTELDLADGVALVRGGDPGYTTTARQLTSIEVAGTPKMTSWAQAALYFGEVDVTRQAVSYLRRRTATGEVVGEDLLSLPPRTLRTRAVWWTISGAQRHDLVRRAIDLAGAAHAAEHASIGLLPLFAGCDRWDIGGVSAETHHSTGLLSVFVYDGHEGGAGFAERAYQTAKAWLAATRTAIAGCECAQGCPSCIQSPKCGNGNQPLCKRGAVELLDTLLSGAH